MIFTTNSRIFATILFKLGYTNYVSSPDTIAIPTNQEPVPYKFTFTIPSLDQNKFRRVLYDYKTARP